MRFAIPARPPDGRLSRREKVYPTGVPSVA
jgi:hypothetical protein